MDSRKSCELHHESFPLLMCPAEPEVQEEGGGRPLAAGRSVYRIEDMRRRGARAPAVLTPPDSRQHRRQPERTNMSETPGENSKPGGLTLEVGK